MNDRVNVEKEEACSIFIHILRYSCPSAQVEAFMSNIIPPLVDLISDESLYTINLFMKTILERHNIVWMAKSKIGLAFLTMFLSRAEMLKQMAPQQGSDAPSEQDLFLW